MEYQKESTNTPSATTVIQALKGWFRNMFSLRQGAISEDEILNSFSKNAEFKGARLWVLILAMLIASVGLNVNSTAVIIGAMLISPLMDPIIATGVGISANNFDLIKRSLYQLGMAVLFSVITSCLYFLLSPIKTAQSELLARTEPAIWDVFIAFFGGLAGIIGVTRSDKGNTLAGVAIATALMPPLCTAGYGLATGHLDYFFGALYLFTINGVFIVCATVAITSYMRFSGLNAMERRSQRKLIRTVLIAAGITILPSIYLAYKLVKRSSFERHASEFIEQEMVFDGTAVINQKVDHTEHRIEVFLLGKPVSKSRIKELNKKLGHYELGETKLIVHQGEEEKSKDKGPDQLYANMVDKMYFTYKEQIQKLSGENEQLKNHIKHYQKFQVNSTELYKELHALFPEVKAVSCSRSVLSSEILEADTVVLAVLQVGQMLNKTEVERVGDWIAKRLDEHHRVHIIQEKAEPTE